jgi:PPOX class probable F420-dependent enzyme
MDLEQARNFLRQHHRAVLATRRANGEPQLSPILATVDSAGDVIVSTRETAFKTKNIRRDPRVSVCVMNDAFFGPWIQIDGRAEVISLPDAMEPLVDYYKRTNGEHPDWDDYRRAMRDEKRVLVRIKMDKAGPDRQG